VLYTYSDIHRGLRAAALTLTHATVRSGHVAVWLGASSGQDDWLQAGIEKTDGIARPHVYVEVGGAGGTHFIDLGPYSFGQTVHVRLRNKGRLWTVYVNGKILATKLLRAADLIATGESWQDTPNDYSFAIRAEHRRR
jgi:hypothetical protein